MGLVHRTKITDRRFLDWHLGLELHLRMIDIDGVEVNQQNEPILAYELTAQVEYKNTKILCNTAKRLGIPAYL